MKSKIFILDFLFILFLPIWLCGTSSDGDLDPTFGIDGKVISDLPTIDRAIAVAVQPDGKIVIAGNRFTVVRYRTDGSLDNTFGNGGMVTTDFEGYTESVTDLAIQADGKIVLTGYVESVLYKYFALVRYNSDGSLDSTFDEDGKLIIDFGNGIDTTNAVFIQSDGKIIAGGSADANFALVRCNSNGTLDTSFSGTGKVKTNIGIFDDIRSIAVQPNGKIVAAGIAKIGANTDFALARYMPDGHLDNSFGNAGIVTTDIFGGFDWATDATLQPDKKILVVGYTFSNDEFLFSLVRYDSDGSLDTTFDEDGIVTTDFGFNINEASSLEVQPDGKIVVAGVVSNGTSDHFGLARYNADGSLDSSFGSEGKVITDFGGYFDGAIDVVLQPDRKIIAAGYVRSNINDDNVAVARYIGTTFQFVDNFSDGDITGWTEFNPKWTESEGSLVGSPKQKEAMIVASPIFAGCDVCSLETAVRTDGGVFGKIWLLGWYVDKDNTMELLMNERTDRWVLKQKRNGSVVTKAKGNRSIEKDRTYQIKIVYNGSVFKVYVDDFVKPLFIMVPTNPVVTGTLGFRVINTTGSFDFVGVN